MIRFPLRPANRFVLTLSPRPRAGPAACIQPRACADYRRMIVRLSSSVVRASLVLLACLLTVGFCYSSVRRALAHSAVELNTLDGYERATRLAPDDALNWHLLGRYWQYRIDSPDTHRAILSYEKALSLDSRSADTWLDLATAYETEADLASARRAYLQAKTVYPLSPDVSWWYGNFLLRRGETDSAFTELRQAVLVDPKRASAAFALAIRERPDIQSVLNRVLPPSADAYLGVIESLASEQQTEQALILWSRLKALAPQISLRQSYPLIEALLNKTQIADAERVWNDALSLARISRPPDIPGSLVWDGGFESDVRGGGFAWRYPAVGNDVQVALDSKEKHSGSRSLRLVFNGLRNVDFHDVCQYVAVTPVTAYHFSAWIRTEALSTDQGVRFALYPLGDPASPPSSTEDIRGTQAWGQVSLPWTSDSGVGALRLCVERLQSAGADNKIHGLAWIDDVVLVPDTPGNSRR